MNILQQHLSSHKVYAFGSRVTGKSKPFSDLDLIVLTEEPLPALTMYHLTNAFEESSLPFKVDVIDWSNISDEFKKIIQSHWVKIQ